MNQNELAQINADLQGLDALGRLQWVAERFPTGAKFSSSMGMEDQALTHLIAENKLPIEIFTLDTGRLFEEVLQTFDATLKRYSVPIKVYHPDASKVEELLENNGAFSFYESVEKRKECCAVRKLNPLRKALQNASVWVTGIRAEQSDNRENFPVAEWDEGHQVLKIHPLVNWSWEETQKFVKENKVPICSLHARNYPSIGCAPCTKAVRPGDDFRSGRWWWENGIKECGLHK